MFRSCASRMGWRGRASRLSGGLRESDWKVSSRCVATRPTAPVSRMRGARRNARRASTSPYSGPIVRDARCVSLNSSQGNSSPTARPDRVCAKPRRGKYDQRATLAGRSSSKSSIAASRRMVSYAIPQSEAGRLGRDAARLSRSVIIDARMSDAFVLSKLLRRRRRSGGRRFFACTPLGTPLMPRRATRFATLHSFGPSGLWRRWRLRSRRCSGGRRRWSRRRRLGQRLLLLGRVSKSESSPQPHQQNRLSARDRLRLGSFVHCPNSNVFPFRF